MDEDKERRFSFAVEGMTCASCVRIVEGQLKKVEGVQLASVNLATGKAYVVSEPTVTFDTLGEAVRQAGYKASEAAPTEDVLEKRFREARKNLGVVAALTIPVMVLMIIHMTGAHMPWFLPVEMAAGFLALAFPGRGTLKGAFIAVTHRHANMDTLVSLGAVSAWITAPLALAGMEIRSFGALAAMLIGFHLTGRYIEARLKYRASRDMRALMALQIKEATVLNDQGEPTPLPVEGVKPGMRILVRTGERIPLDGRILKGRGAVDESMINGEPVPRMCEENDGVIGGTVLQTGLLEIEVEQPSSEGYLARMVKLIEEAQSSRVPIQATADRVAAVFIPVVFSLALAAALIWYFFFPALTPFLEAAASVIPWVTVTDPVSTAVFVFVATLVIACPCALGLATPMALVTGSGLAARRGILIKTGEAIQKAGEIDVILLDKTGTITEGKPRVVEFNGDGETLAAAVRLEENSLHPLALAVRNYADTLPAGKEEALEREELTGFEEIPGVGARAEIGGTPWQIGRPRDPERYARAAAEGNTIVEVSRDGEIKGSFFIKDPLKKEAPALISELKKRGIRPVMVTGDGQGAAEAAARAAGIDEIHAGVMPDGKLTIVQDHQRAGHTVAMAGDGINDAAALKAAEVGFAMGTGTDLSMESGDIILNNGDISRILEAFDISALTFRTIKQNLFWAFLYNAVAIPLALAGLLHPVLAELAMTFSSLNVIYNSLRIGKVYKPVNEPDVKEKEMKYEFSVPDMTCGHCKMRIEKSLAEQGVEEVTVDLEAKTVTAVTGKEAEELMRAMGEAGYPATLTSRS
jgi:P-type Cu+ transporter